MDELQRLKRIEQAARALSAAIKVIPHNGQLVCAANRDTGQAVHDLRVALGIMDPEIAERLRPREDG